MKILRKILVVIASIVLIGVAAFFIVGYNPKPNVITLERIALTEQQIDKIARDKVDQMSVEEKVEMMTPRLSSNLKFILEIIGDGMKYNQAAYQAGGNERLQNSHHAIF